MMTTWGRNMWMSLSLFHKVVFWWSVYVLLIYSSLYVPPAPSERHTQPTVYYVFFVSLTNLSSMSYTTHRQMVEWLLN